MVRLGITIAIAIVAAFLFIILVIGTLNSFNGNTYGPCKEAPQYQCANGG